MAEKNTPSPKPRPPALTRKEGEIRSQTRDGFLPIQTNLFDRFFIAAVILIGIHLLWLRFMEPPLPEPTLHMAAPMIISLIVGYVVVRKG